MLELAWQSVCTRGLLGPRPLARDSSGSARGFEPGKPVTHFLYAEDTCVPRGRGFLPVIVRPRCHLRSRDRTPVACCCDDER